jgi:heavy metal response regulator
MRILVIEDEQKVAAFIKRGLKEEGYAVDVAFDGEQGYSLTAANEYDLVVLDVMIPKMDGLTLCHKLRQEGFTAPVLMLTAKDAVRDKVKGLDAGASDYLTKPFAFAEFLARIRALLRRGESRQSASLQVADLILDPAKRHVSRAGKKIELTAKEFALLEYLMRNAGSIVTRTMIAEHVWDLNFETFTNVIDVYINHVRRKIDRGFSRKLVHTIRGRGYVLQEPR